jgi:hypothetical protein
MLMGGHRGFLISRSKTMAKVETFAMAFGLFLTGILTFAALPLA